MSPAALWAPNNTSHIYLLLFAPRSDFFQGLVGATSSRQSDSSVLSSNPCGNWITLLGLLHTLWSKSSAATLSQHRAIQKSQNLRAKKENGTALWRIFGWGNYLPTISLSTVHKSFSCSYLLGTAAPTSVLSLLAFCPHIYHHNLFSHTCTIIGSLRYWTAVFLAHNIRALASPVLSNKFSSSGLCEKSYLVILGCNIFPFLCFFRLRVSGDPLATSGLSEEINLSLSCLFRLCVAGEPSAPWNNSAISHTARRYVS